MQIHREYATDARSIEQIRHELGRDRHPRLVFAVLSRVPEKWDHGGDSVRARPTGRVHHDQQFHQVLVRRRRRRLNDEYVATADIFLDLYVGFTIRKRADCRLSERRPNVIANSLRQLAIGGAAKDLHLWLKREHRVEGALT